MAPYWKFVELVATMLIHLLLLYAPFSIYYTVPILTGLTPIPMNIEPPATHVILMVADGLRADAVFDSTMKNMPFLKSVLLDTGVWGIAHTHIPTESRSAHLAMLGGFYEDIASVTKGWKVHPIEVDTMFNRTLRSAGFGTYKLVDSFALYPNISMKTVSPSRAKEELVGSNIMLIDNWMVDKFLDYVKDDEHGLFTDKKPSALDMKSHRRGHMVYLHLEAADLVGHGQKPKSTAYEEMLRNLDQMVAKATKAVQEAALKRSDKVTFIFTADHGMTDYGSHGAGAPEETTTPLLIWGSGIVKPGKYDRKDSNPHHYDNPLKLPLIQYGHSRFDVEQADLCPLMASLLGVPIPVNSVGLVSLDLLDIPIESKAILASTNAKQVVDQLKLIREKTRSSHRFGHFKEYRALDLDIIDDTLKGFDDLAAEKKYNIAITGYQQLARKAIEGITYYHNYDASLLGFCVGASFILWILLTLCDLMHVDEDTGTNGGIVFSYACLFRILITVVLVLFGIGILISTSKSDIVHSIYLFLPIGFAIYLLNSQRRRSQVCLLFHTLLCESKRFRSVTVHVALLFLFSMVLFQLLIWGFYIRSLISGACVLVGIWPLIDKTFGDGGKMLKGLWFLSCSIMAIFPLLVPNVMAYIPLLAACSGVVLAAVSYIEFRWISKGAVESTVRTTRCFLPGLGCTLTVFVIGSSVCLGLVHLLPEDTPLVRIFIHLYSWLMLVTKQMTLWMHHFSHFLACFLVVLPTLFILFHSPPLLAARLYGWIVVLLIPTILLSTSYEVLFFAILVCTNILWLKMETPTLQYTDLRILTTPSDSSRNMEKTHSNEDAITFCDFRQALFSVFFFLIAFFGSGHVPSFSGYDSRSVYCFLTMTESDIMAFLHFSKVVMFVLCTGLFQTAVQMTNQMPNMKERHISAPPNLNIQSRLKQALLLLIVFIHFVLLRRDSDWWAIGVGIGHYAIAMIISMFTTVIHSLSYKMLSFDSSQSPSYCFQLPQ